MKRRNWTLLVTTMLAGCGGAESPTQPGLAGSPGEPALVVTSARWEAPQPIADAGALPLGRCSPFTEALCPTFSERTAPVVAANARGQAIALWQRWDGEAYRLVSGRFTPGGGWSDARHVTEATGVLGQRVVFDRGGNAIALWFEAGEARTSYGPAAGGWGPPQAIEGAVDPRLAMDEGGAGHLLFRRVRGGLLWSRLPPGSAWTEPVTIQDQGTTSQPFVADARLAVTRGGSVRAAWVRSFQSPVRDEEWDEVWSSDRLPGQAWAAPSILARFPRANALSLAMGAADGAGVTAYQLVERLAGGGDLRRVIEQHRTPGAGGPEAWSAPAAVSDPPPAPPAVRSAERPAVADDARGALTLAWAEASHAPADTHRYQIRARRFSSATGAWGATQSIADAPGFLHDRFGLHVAASAAGNAVVLWTQQEAFQSRLWASVSVPGAGWSPPEQLRVTERLAAPDLAMDGAGNAIVMWSEPEGDRARIWSARLTAVTAATR